MLVPVLSPLAALLTGRAALKEGKSGAASAGIVLGVTALSFTALGVLLALLALIFNAI